MVHPESNPRVGKITRVVEVFASECKHHFQHASHPTIASKSQRAESRNRMKKSSIFLS